MPVSTTSNLASRAVYGWPEDFHQLEPRPLGIHLLPDLPKLLSPADVPLSEWVCQQVGFDLKWLTVFRDLHCRRVCLQVTDVNISCYFLQIIMQVAFPCARQH